MQERVSTLEIRKKLGELLDRVALRHDEFLIERKGRLLAAMVPVEKLRQLERLARLKLLEALDARPARPSAAEADALSLKAKYASRKVRARQIMIRALLHADVFASAFIQPRGTCDSRRRRRTRDTGPCRPQRP